MAGQVFVDGDLSHLPSLIQRSLGCIFTVKGIFGRRMYFSSQKMKQEAPQILEFSIFVHNFCCCPFHIFLISTDIINLLILINTLWLSDPLKLYVSYSRKENFILCFWLMLSDHSPSKYSQKSAKVLFVSVVILKFVIFPFLFFELGGMTHEGLIFLILNSNTKLAKAKRVF